MGAAHWPQRKRRRSCISICDIPKALYKAFRKASPGVRESAFFYPTVRHKPMALLHFLSWRRGEAGWVFQSRAGIAS
jgi:hypothetical protein